MPPGVNCQSTSEKQPLFWHFSWEALKIFSNSFRKAQSDSKFSQIPSDSFRKSQNDSKFSQIAPEYLLFSLNGDAGRRNLWCMRWLWRSGMPELPALGFKCTNFWKSSASAMSIQRLASTKPIRLSNISAPFLQPKNSVDCVQSAWNSGRLMDS